MDEPQEIYLTVVTVLDGLNDDRAGTWLQRAHDLIMADANRIQDETLRRSYLNNVPACRSLLALWDRSKGTEV